MEMNHSATLLEAEGDCPWELDVWWLRSGGPLVGSDNNAGGGLQPSGSIDGDLQGEGEQNGGEKGNGEHADSTPELPPLAIGEFVFLLAEGAPFLAGQVTGGRRTGEDARHDEVEVHWWSPSNRNVREDAKNLTTLGYGKGVFTKDFRRGEQSPSSKKKPTYSPSVGWVARQDVVASCKSLRGGKYIPGPILRALEAAGHEHDADEGDADHEGRSPSRTDGVFGEDTAKTGISNDDENLEEDRG